MSTTTISMTKERRSSSIPWIKIPKLPLRALKRKESLLENAGAAATIPSPLLELPSELMVEIVSNLELQDVLTLRRTNRIFDNLITGPDSDIARYWSRYRLIHIPRLLNNDPAPGEHWTYVVRQTRRWYLATELADLIGYYVQYKTPLHHNVQRNLRFAPLARRIQERMIPLLFMMSTYLAQSKALLMGLAAEDDLSVECQAHLDAHTYAALEGTPLCDLKALHYTWLFLLWLLNFVLSRPTYAGTVERTVRGWIADPLDRCSLARILVFGNLPAITKILQLRDYNERRKWAQHFLKSLNPDNSTKWTEKWDKLDVGLDDLPDEAQARKAINIDIHMHCLWTTGATLVFDKAGEDNILLDDERKPSTITTMRLLADLAGYDLFHANVPQTYTESSRSDASTGGESDVDEATAND